MEDKIYFASIKEGRGRYFVEYSPPLHGCTFAMLQLTFTDETPLDVVASAMEVEGAAWLSRYPLPLMVSSFGPSGDLVYLEGVRPENHYMLYLAPGDGQVRAYWRLLVNEEMPQEALSRDRLLSVYSGVPYRTSEEVKAGAEKHAREMKLGWYIVFLWVVVGPGAFLVVEHFGPQWLTMLVFLYGLYKATKKAFKMTGRWKKSSKELAKEEGERLMRHHHYHCQQNPEGFLKLKLENFKKDQCEEIRKEAEALNQKTRDD